MAYIGSTPNSGAWAGNVPILRFTRAGIVYEATLVLSAVSSADFTAAKITSAAIQFTAQGVVLGGYEGEIIRVLTRMFLSGAFPKVDLLSDTPSMKITPAVPTIAIQGVA